MSNSNVHALNILLAVALVDLTKQGILNIISDILRIKPLAYKLQPRKVTQKLHFDDEVIYKWSDFSLITRFTVGVSANI